MLCNSQSICALLVGEGKNECGLKPIAVRMVWKGKLSFGYQQDISPFYEISDLIVLPSLVKDC
jgi:hypothetical protein